MLRVILAASLLVSAAGCKPAANNATAAHRTFHGPQDVLRSGRLEVDVMEFAVPRRLVELSQRLSAAAAKNPLWMAAQAVQAKPGEPIAYNPKLGLTRDEYDEFLALSKQMIARKKSAATLTITLNAQGVYVLDGGAELPELTGIEIDLKNNRVRTPLGVAGNRTEIHADEESALGRWNGVQWKSDDENVVTVLAGGIVSLSLGIIDDTGRGVLYYRAQKLGLTGITDITSILEFDLPAE